MCNLIKFFCMLKIGLSQLKTIPNRNNVGKTATSAVNFATNPIRELKRDTFIPSNITKIVTPMAMPTFTGHDVDNREPSSNYAMGKSIAENMFNLIDKKVGAVSNYEFQEELSKVTAKNVTHLIRSYDKLSPKESLITAICNEKSNSCENRKYALGKIFNCLVQKSKTVDNIDTKYYNKSFKEELDKQFAGMLPTNTNKLDKLTNALIQDIANKKSITKEDKKFIRVTEPKKLQEYSIKVAENMCNKTEDNFNKGNATYGWSAKLAENIGKLWKSENTYELVKGDIEEFKREITELKVASKEGSENYKKKFKEIFNKEYDAEAILAFKDKEKQLQLSMVSNCLESNFKSMCKDILDNKYLIPKYILPASTGSTIVVTENKTEVYNKAVNTFSEFLGKGDIEKGKKLLQKELIKAGCTEKTSQEKKYQIIHNLAEKQAKILNKNTKTLSNGKDIATLKKEFNNSYYAAFGVDNDIAKRVSDYHSSQVFGSSLISDSLMGALSTALCFAIPGTGLLPTLKLMLGTSGITGLVMTTDAMSSKQGMTQKDIEETLKNVALDSVSTLAGELAAKGISCFTDALSLTKTGAKLTEFALVTAADLCIDSSFEFLATGKITVQGVVLSAVFSSTGQIIDLKVSHVQRKTL